MKPLFQKSFRRTVMLSALLVSIVAVQATLQPQRAHALSGTDFRAGNIIDDSVFYDENTMTPEQIQSFLNAKLPACDTWGQKIHSTGQTRAQYGASKGYPAPYTCLKDYRQDVPAITNSGSNLCTGSISAGNKSAAQIIYEVGRACNINPQVLIVMLQKEQSLVTDDWPWSIQYDKAMGYYCPDDPSRPGWCHPDYAGFFNQVYNAAQGLQRYAANPTSYNYRAGRNNTILYNPVTSCGSSTVFIQNQATASLYIYTPYQPNQAALSNLYGTGNSCSAYGNRNFWRMFNDWFGSTLGSPFFQFPGSPQTYVLGANNTYYYISTYERLKDYGFETRFGKRTLLVDRSYVNNLSYKGNLPEIARFEGDGVFVASEGLLHGFSSPELFQDYGYAFGQEATLAKWMFTSLGESSPMESILRLSDSPTIYRISNGTKQPMCSWEAYTSQGQPIYSSLAYVRLTSSFANRLPNGVPIAANGDMVVATDNYTYGVWNDTGLMPFDNTVAGSTGIGACTTTSTHLAQMPYITQTPLTNFVKDQMDNLYIINFGNLIQLEPSQINEFGLTDKTFVTLNNEFLNKFTKTTTRGLFRINGTDPVYLIHNGKSYGIPSPDDLYALGYRFNQVTNYSQKTAQLFPNSGTIYKPGRVVRIGNSDGVYLLDTPFKKIAFPSAEIFLSYGYKWDEVTRVSEESLRGYSTSSNTITSHVQDSSGNQWVIGRGVRHKISPELTNVTNYDLTSPTLLSSAAIYRIPVAQDMTKVFRRNTGDAVYLIDQGKKRQFTSAEAFLSNGHTWGDVISLPPVITDNIPAGPPVY